MYVSTNTKFIFAFLLTALCLSGGCAAQPTATPPPPALVIYNWSGDLPASVLTGFTEAAGIPVETLSYLSMEEALDNLRHTEKYDIVNLDNRHIPAAISEGLLAPLNPSGLTNFYNISPNFRDMVYDPGNRYTVPYNWGISGLAVRADLAGRQGTGWGDLWELSKTGKIVFWRGIPRVGIGAALHSLGFSTNTENTRELDAALALLMILRPQVIFMEDYGLVTSIPLLESGEAVAALGFALDAQMVKDNPDIKFVLPGDGTLLWMENFVIPASSLNHENAEIFLNYYLRPEIAAQITNQNYYATPNQNAIPMVDAAILNNPFIFPPQESLANAEIILPLSVEAEQRYAALWKIFLEGGAP